MYFYIIFLYFFIYMSKIIFVKYNCIYNKSTDITPFLKVVNKLELYLIQKDVIY